MADTAIFCSRQVTDMFAQSGNPIVAGCAVTRDTRVIEYARSKTGNTMADPAILGGGYMSR